MPSEDIYAINIDGRWGLEDLYVLPHAYEQVYFLIYSLMPGRSQAEIDRIYWAFQSLPWQGGYSAVNFYNQLRFITPKRERPRIVSIRYSSPGWIELALIVGVAYNIEKIVGSICRAARDINATYRDIMKTLQERRLLRLDQRRRELEFSAYELRIINHSLKEMAEMLKIDNLQEINQRTGHPYKSLKILLSLYRRVRTLVEYQNKGKINLLGDKEKP